MVGTESLESFFLDQNIEIKLGDSITIKSETKPAYLGNVQHIALDPDEEDSYLVTVAWYYRPTEVHGGCKMYHGEKEVLSSDHIDTIDSSTIIGHCKVLTLEQYMELKTIPEHTYYSRFFYSPSRKIFKPDSVAVFCYCEMPYNPDLEMIMCEKCEEWFHPQCLGKPMKELTATNKFMCADCRRRW